jgi:hypothetical protein
MAIILAAFSLMVLDLWTPHEFKDEKIMQLIVIFWVTLPIFTAFSLFFKKRWPLLLGLGAALFLFFTTEDTMREEDIQVFMLWGGAFYSLLFVLPHWKNNQNNGFWTYCTRILFILILGFACSGILAASLTLALESIRTLFEVDIDYRWMETMAMFAFFFVLPMFVHIGLPQDWKTLEKNTEHPHFFRPLSAYLLTPISVLFFGILTVYALKILITTEWPSGQVAYPVLYLSLVTFGFYLISYPWRQTWQRWFFAALLPFLAMYFIALGMRIEQYGLTEMRYLGLILGACLVLESFYFAFIKRQRLQMMLIPLAIAAFVFAVGPWGANELPIRSQEKRLEAVLIEIGALQDDRLVLVEASTVPDETVVQISSIVHFLSRRDRLSDLQEWTSVDLFDGRSGEEFMKAMGLEYQPWGIRDKGRLLRFSHSSRSFGTEDFYPISGFDFQGGVDLSYIPHLPEVATQTLSLQEETLVLGLSPSGMLTLGRQGAILSFDLMALEKVLPEYTSKTDPTRDVEDFVLNAENSTMRVRIYITHLSGGYSDASETVFEDLSLNGEMLVDFK